MEILVAGVDSTGGHLHTVVDPGVSQCFDALGYCGIGSGSPHATLSFIHGGFTIEKSVNEAVFMIFEAKRIAESAPGVGQQTDMVIIGEKIVHLTEEDLENLKTISDRKIEFDLRNNISEMITNLPFDK